MNQQTYSTWWQRTDLCYQDQQLIFAGQPVAMLAARCGTPSFVYSARRVLANLDRLHKALQKAGFARCAGRNKSEHQGLGYRLYYAMKANRFAPLLTLLKQAESCGIDACSPGEVEHAVSCGFEPAEISFTAGSLSATDVQSLARYEGLYMDCDSLHAIRAWGTVRPGTEIGLRVNPAIGIGRADNEKLHYAGALTTKFGIYEEQFTEALQLAASYNLKIGKIHFHTGCGYLTPQLGQLEAVIRHCLRFVDQANAAMTQTRGQRVKQRVQRVNIGGGLGVPHVGADQALDLQRWAGLLAELLAGRELQLEVEPGDYLVKDAGVLLLEVTFAEQKRDTFFVGTNAGFSIAPEPAYYNLPFQPLALYHDGTPCTPVQVVGNINEALDVWYEKAWLPKLQAGDTLALINAGAYSAAMASNHCLRGQFKEFLLFS